MSLRRDATRRRIIGSVALLVATVVFILPFVFILFMAVKTKQEAARFLFTWPSDWRLWQNLVDVVQTRNYMLLLDYFKSTLIMVGAMTLLRIFGAMVGYILQRRPTGWNKLIYACVLIGLMVPLAEVPTIWVLQGLGLFKTIHGMILIQVAYGLTFSVLLYRSFIVTIPHDLDEAAIIDGAKPWPQVHPAAADLGRDRDCGQGRDRRRTHGPRDCDAFSKLCALSTFKRVR